MAHILGAHLLSNPSARYRGWRSTETLEVALGYLNYAHQFAVDPVYKQSQIEPALFFCEEQVRQLKRQDQAEVSHSSQVIHRDKEVR